MLDPNVSLDPFYSSLSQCAASVVGLLGAVLASRLQEQFAKVKASHEHVARLIGELRHDVGARVRDVRMFSQFAERRVTELQVARAHGKAAIVVVEERAFWGGSRPAGASPVGTEETVANRYKFMREYVAPTLEVLEAHAGLREVGDIEALRGDLHRLENILPHDLQGAIGAFHQKMDEIEEANDAHLQASSFRVPTLVAVILGWLSVSGLVVPLAYLSASGPGPKYFLLLAFSLGVLAIPAYIGYELLALFRLRTVRLGEGG